MSRKWQSLNDVINKDRHEKTGVAYLDAPRYGEKNISYRPRVKKEEDKVHMILKRHMSRNKFYETRQLRNVIGKNSKYNLARELLKYPKIFERVGRGVWRLNE